jgi:MarR family transcriptional regulator, 2-MHQ and catechol-resistance regulon repressor
MPTHFKGSPRDVLALDTFIKLMRASGTVVSRLYAPLQRDHGMTESQLGVLEALLHLGPMPQTALCGKLLKSGSNLTTVVDNLERRGWVRRVRGADDRRVQVVHLTAAGRKAIEAVFPEHVERVAGCLGNLTRDEQRELGRLCKKLGQGSAEEE